MKKLVALPRTLEAVVRSWMSSEQTARKLVSERYRAHDEVFITRLFCGELGANLHEANEGKIFERALAADLDAIFDDELASEIRRISRGIVARVSYHEPHTERFSGGDLGFTVVRPNIWSLKEDELAHALHEQGVLCQAKRQTLSGDWGSFTDRQLKVLPDHLAYLSLLFYGYEEKTRHNLSDFSWKLCNGYTMDEVRHWLRTTTLSDSQDSRAVLRALGRGEIGTSDSGIISSVICPKEKAHIKVEVTWRDDYPKPKDGGGGPSGGHGIKYRKSLGELLEGKTKKHYHQHGTFHRQPPKTRFIKGGK